MSYGSIAEKVHVYQVAARRGSAGPHFLEADAIASSPEAAERIINAHCQVRSLDWTYVSEPVPGCALYRANNGAEFYVTAVELDAPLKN